MMIFILKNFKVYNLLLIIIIFIFAKQNVGVPVYTWNGNGYTQSHYQQASKIDEYIHWIVGIDVVDGLRPIERCGCDAYVGSAWECKSIRQGGHGWSERCGWSLFGNQCSGECFKIFGPQPN